MVRGRGVRGNGGRVPRQMPQGRGGGAWWFPFPRANSERNGRVIRRGQGQGEGRGPGQREDRWPPGGRFQPARTAGRNQAERNSEKGVETRQQRRAREEEEEEGWHVVPTRRRRGTGAPAAPQPDSGGGAQEAPPGDDGGAPAAPARRDGGGTPAVPAAGEERRKRGAPAVPLGRGDGNKRGGAPAAPPRTEGEEEASQDPPGARAGEGERSPSKREARKEEGEETHPDRFNQEGDDDGRESGYGGSTDMAPEEMGGSRDKRGRGEMGSPAPSDCTDVDSEATTIDPDDVSRGSQCVIGKGTGSFQDHQLAYKYQRRRRQIWAICEGDGQGKRTRDLADVARALQEGIDVAICTDEPELVEQLRDWEKRAFDRRKQDGLEWGAYFGDCDCHRCWGEVKQFAKILVGEEGSRVHIEYSDDGLVIRRRRQQQHGGGEHLPGKHPRPGVPLAFSWLHVTQPIVILYQGDYRPDWVDQRGNLRAPRRGCEVVRTGLPADWLPENLRVPTSDGSAHPRGPGRAALDDGGRGNFPPSLRGRLGGGNRRTALSRAVVKGLHFPLFLLCVIFALLGTTQGTGEDKWPIRVTKDFGLVDSFVDLFGEKVKGHIPSPDPVHTIEEAHLWQKLWQNGNRARKTRAAVEADSLIFNAYDCTAPVNVTTLTVRHDPVCDEAPIDHQPEEKEYALLERVTKTRMPIYRCQAKRYKTVHHCGMHSHTTLLPLEWQFDVDVNLSGKQCREARETGQWKIPGLSQPQPVKTEGTTYVHIPTVGWTGGGKIQCQGASYKYREYQKNKPWAERSEGVIVTDHYKMQIYEEVATIDTSGTVTVGDGVRLPCLVEAKECKIDGGRTYYWKPPTEKEKCPFYRNRIIKGVEVPDLDGKTVFMSTDGSMIRLKKGGPQSQCGGIVHETDYSRLFLAEQGPGTIKVAEFERPIHPSMMSLVTYTNQQDSFLFHQLLKEMNSRFKTARAERCQEATNRKTGEYARRAAEQHAIQDGETVHLGGGQFVTAAGEAWYHYRCRRRVVKVRETDGCYASLPVQMGSADFGHYLRERSQIKGKRKEAPATNSPTSNHSNADSVFTTLTNQFFLEPRTHRLVAVAVPSVCATPFAPLYQNHRGEWLAYEGKHMFLTSRPAVIENIKWNWEEPPPESPAYDFEQGGIYTAAQIRSMDRYQQVTRAGTAVSNTLGQGLEEQLDARRPLDAAQVFPNIPLLSNPVVGKWMSWFIKWLQAYGNACSVIVATCLIYRFCSWAVGVILRLATIPLTGNLCVHIAGAFCPSFREFLRAPAAWCRRCCGLEEKPAYEATDVRFTRRGSREAVEIDLKPASKAEKPPKTKPSSGMSKSAMAGQALRDWKEGFRRRRLEAAAEDEIPPSTSPPREQPPETGAPLPVEKPDDFEYTASRNPTLAQAALHHAAQAVYPGLQGQHLPVTNLPPIGGHQGNRN